MKQDWHFRFSIARNVTILIYIVVFEAKDVKRHKATVCDKKLNQIESKNDYL